MSMSSGSGCNCTDDCPTNSDVEESQPSPSISCSCDTMLYFVSALAIVFLLTTVILALVLIVLLVRKRGRNPTTEISGKGKMNPSYWISDYDLDNPKISSSTPNLSDWASPQLSRPARTFFAPLERVTEEKGSSDFEPKHGMVSSKSMAPIAINVKPAPKMRKSVSYNDIEQRPFSPKNATKSKAERRRAPSPPKKDMSSPTEDRRPVSSSDNSPNLLSDDSHKSSSKESSSGDAHKPLYEEKPTPLPRRKKDTDSLPKKRRKSVNSDYDSLVPDYMNVEKFVSATVPADPSPLYQELNTRLLDNPAVYETLADVRKK